MDRVQQRACKNNSYFFEVQKLATQFGVGRIYSQISYSARRDLGFIRFSELVVQINTANITLVQILCGPKCTTFSTSCGPHNMLNLKFII